MGDPPLSRLFQLGLGLLGVGAVTAGGYLAYVRWRREDGEPAAPTTAPPLTGGSGIAETGDEVEALARTIASEAGSGTAAEQRSIGWVVRNRFRGKSIYKVQYPWRAQKGADPPFSSARPANDSHRALARQILAADQSEDPTGGATSFFEPRMQDAFAKAGTMARAGETGNRVIDGVPLTDITRFKFYKKSADQVRAKWSPGSTMYATAGRFELWGSARLFAKRGGVVQTIVGADRNALARVIEACGTDLVERQACAWALRNRAASVGGTLSEVAAVYPQAAPSEESRLVAACVAALPDDADPTDGAVDFWRPRAQHVISALGALCGEARDRGDDETAAALAPFADSPDEIGARDVLAASGLVTCGVAGELELLRCA